MHGAEKRFEGIYVKRRALRPNKNQKLGRCHINLPLGIDTIINPRV